MHQKLLLNPKVGAAPVHFSEKFPEMVDSLPTICGYEEEITRAAGGTRKIFSTTTEPSLTLVQSAFAIALHMHQPVIPAGGDGLLCAAFISNLEHLFKSEKGEDRYNASMFAWCYSRIADFIRELVEQGGNPRVMLDYSGTLLWGLQLMGRKDILDNLKSITLDRRYSPYVEWLGTMWGHPVASSTPVADFKLHLRAWQHHFASIFGLKALDRIRGFSPPEMNLPNHPETCYEYIKALKECGYRWLLVQEHTVEQLDGSPLSRPHLPHLLIARNFKGEEVSIIALIKTQGSDTKLVAQMQPFYEAKGLKRDILKGVEIPPLVTQISDGENGGVMMNEFPSAFKSVFQRVSRTGVVGMNGTEYLELIEDAGCTPEYFIPVQPRYQHLIWRGIKRGKNFKTLIEEIRRDNPTFHLEGGSWTSNLSWVRGYEEVLDPINALSLLFHEKLDGFQDSRDFHYRQALLHLLISQTSCFRYWGQGIWTDYAREICRRGTEILNRYF